MTVHLADPTSRTGRALMRTHTQTDTNTSRKPITRETIPTTQPIARNDTYDHSRNHRVYGGIVTPESRRQLRAVAEKAIPGPWNAYRCR